MPITLPALPEQKRIAAILERADRLRRLRRYALRLSDAYLQDEFVEMFGDLAQNPRRWESRALGEYVRFLTSGSRGWAAFVADDGPLFLRIQNVGNGRLLLDDIAHVRPPDTAEAGRTKVCPRDLVLSITADLGRTAVIPRGFPEAYVNQHLALARLAGVNPVFVAGYFSSKHGRAQIQRLDRAGVKSGLNFDDIRGLMVPAPPISLQDEYERIVRRYEHLRAQQREAERQAGHLFQTLLQWAFRGEL
jgi:type I restriction enzyme S subunit